MQGIDYASVDENQPPDVLKARAAGVKFAIVRGAYTIGPKSVADTHMARDRNAWGAQPGSSARIPGAFGSYVIFGWAANDPPVIEQARAFIAAYGRRLPGELPPTMDVEFPFGRAASGRTPQEIINELESGYVILREHYSVVMTYTSTRLWREDLDNIDAPWLAESPLWIKTPYVYKAGNKPHPEACPATVGDLPKPWMSADSAGAWVHQYQGDAKGYPGFTSTVDCNRFVPFVTSAETSDARVAWIKRRLATYNCSDLLQLQRVFGLQLDGVIGPATFSYLTA